MNKKTSIDSNAAALAAVAPAASVPVSYGPKPDDNNPTIVQQKAAIVDALEALITASTFMVNIPDPNGDRDVEFASEDQNGEVEVVRCRSANRFGRLQRGLLDQLVRQLNYALDTEMKDFTSGQAQIRSMLNAMTRSDDPARIRDSIANKSSYLNLVKERIAHIQALLDAANTAYIDLTGTAYVSYEERAKTRRVLPVPTAPSSDPVLAAAAALAAE